MGSGTETLGAAVSCLNDTLHLAEIGGITVPRDRCHPILAGRFQMATPHDGPALVQAATCRSARPIRTDAAAALIEMSEAQTLSTVRYRWWSTLGGAGGPAGLPSG